MNIADARYGLLPDGRAVEVYTLANARGMAVRVMTYGSTLVGIEVPDRRGDCADVLLGFDDFGDYLSAHPYFGGTIGRYANRIAQGRFTLDGVMHQLACNDGPNHLHGGVEGFDRRLWLAHVHEDRDGLWLDMHYTSPDGEEGYPGTLWARASYHLAEDNVLTVAYEAHCDRRTIVNLTNHAYFNLGDPRGILDHVFELPARHFLPIDATLIPMGAQQSVLGTCMDFTTPARLRERIASGDRQLALAGGYDHTWVLAAADDAPRIAARVHEPGSGRTLEVETTQPGVQFYSGNRLDGTIAGKSGCCYGRHAGFCLEPQRFPDTPNHVSYPSAVLEPGAVYREITRYRFGTA